MQENALKGGFSNAPIQAANAFRTILNVMARPGTIERIEGVVAPAPMSPAAATVALTLCDPETPIYLAPSHDSPQIRAWIAFHIGAPIVEPAKAAFAFGTWEAIQPLALFPIGTSEYPDQSATLIVEREEITNRGAILRGPGILECNHMSLPEIAPFQDNRKRFPLGLDFIFTSGAHISALTRSTIVEAQ